MAKDITNSSQRARNESRRVISATTHYY